LTDQARQATPAGIDENVPSVARMYDYYLGGKDNYEVDRRASDELSAAAPGTRALAINNRRFLVRAVRFLADERGIRQFLDHGSGLPTQDNVHQVAQRVDPTARVVYVDNDPIVLAHGRALLQTDTTTSVIQSDVRDVEAIFNEPEVKELLDLNEPVAALFVSFLHCIPDADDPAVLVGRVMNRLAPGSALVISHLASEDEGTRSQLTEFMQAATQGNWGRVRTAAEIARFFDGLDVLDPGLVEISTWRPDSELGEVQATHEWIEYGGIAIKQ